MKNILIVDGLNYLIPFVYSDKHYFNSNLVDIYPAFKFLSNLSTIKMLYDINKIFVVFEIGRDIRKKKISDIYKANRINLSGNFKTFKDEKIYNLITENRKILINILSNSKVKQYISLFTEADTIIYGIVKFLSENPDNIIYVLSNDSDLFQVFDNLIENKNIKLIRRNLKRNSNEGYFEILEPFSNILDKNKIFKYLIKSDEINFNLNLIEKINIKNVVVLFKALCGDKSDNILNVKNFGIKSFIYLFPYLNSITENFNIDFIEKIDYVFYELKQIAKTDNKLRNIVDNILKEENLIKVNLRLVDLNYSFRELDIKSYKEVRDLCFLEKSIDELSIMKYINEYEINSIEEWSNVILNNILLDKKIKVAIDGKIEKDINYIQKILCRY